jgi:hypothetical protein
MEDKFVHRTRSLAILGITLLLVSLTSACSGSADKDSGVSVPNGGFENGTMEPWAPWQSVQAALDSNHVHGGKFSLAESAARGTVYQDMKGLVPGVGYTISAWVSGSPDATATAQIAVYDAGIQVATFSDAINPTASWQLLKYEFKVSAASQGLARIHLSRNDGNGTIFWDDVQIVRTR